MWCIRTNQIAAFDTASCIIKRWWMMGLKESIMIMSSLVVCCASKSLLPHFIAKQSMGNGLVSNIFNILLNNWCIAINNTPFKQGKGPQIWWYYWFFLLIYISSHSSIKLLMHERKTSSPMNVCINNTGNHYRHQHGHMGIYWLLGWPWPLVWEIQTGSDAGKVIPEPQGMF